MSPTPTEVGRAMTPEEERVRHRLTALLLTAPRWTFNYTESHDLAEWMLKEAARLGWGLSIWADEG